jgi:hypothetical protein
MEAVPEKFQSYPNVTGVAVGLISLSIRTHLPQVLGRLMEAVPEKFQSYPNVSTDATHTVTARWLQEKCLEVLAKNGNAATAGVLVAGALDGLNSALTQVLMMMEHSGNIQGTFREHSGNIQGTLREHSGNIQGTLRLPECWWRARSTASTPHSRRC